jgi:hypothetical protein
VVGYCEHDNEISACIKKGIPWLAERLTQRLLQKRK